MASRFTARSRNSSRRFRGVGGYISRTDQARRKRTKTSFQKRFRFMNGCTYAYDSVELEDFSVISETALLTISSLASAERMERLFSLTVMTTPRMPPEVRTLSP